jgi:hypothetical protein
MTCSSISGYDREKYEVGENNDQAFLACLYIVNKQAYIFSLCGGKRHKLIASPQTRPQADVLVCY